MSVKVAAVAFSLLGTASAIAAEVHRVAAVGPSSGMELPIEPAEAELTAPATSSDEPEKLVEAQPDRGQTPFGVLTLNPRKGTVVDESALRYYAAQKDRKRVDAEIRRIRLNAPKWSPPANLYSSAGSDQGEQPLWDLFGAGHLDELRAKIAQRMAREPNWMPSYELRTKIERQEIREKLIAASDAKKWLAVIDLVKASPQVLTCSDIDSVWRSAEAVAKTNDMAGAAAIFRVILIDCTDAEERLATVRKALAVLPISDAQALIALGTKNSDGSSEFDPVRMDIVRARIGAIAAGKAKDDLSPGEIKEFGEAAVKLQSGDDSGLLGWYNYSRSDWATADDWFKLALQWSQDAKLAEGHVLSLYKLGQVKAAERVAYEWRDRSTVIRELYIGFLAAEITVDNPRLVFSAELLAEYTQVVVAAKSTNGAQALAWYYFIRDNAPGAVSWFKDAMDYGEMQKKADLDPAFLAKIAEGYALSLQKVGRLEQAQATAYEWRNKSADIKKLYMRLASEYLRQTDPAPQMSPAKLADFAEMAQAEKSVSAAQALGWYFYNQKRFAESVDWFKNVIAYTADGKLDAKTSEGYALALQGAGRLAEAESVAYAWVDRANDMRALYIVIVVEELTKGNPPVTMPKERQANFVTLVAKDRSANGAQALGWYHHMRGEYEGSVAWFSNAIDWSADGKGDAKINEGYALALKALGRLPEAETVAWTWADRASDMRKLYALIVTAELTSQYPRYEVSKEQLSTFVTFVSAQKSANGAQALGWYHFVRGEYAGSLAWFKSSLDLVSAEGATAAETKASVKAAEGYALSLQKLGQTDAAAAIAYEWRARSPALQALYFGILGQTLRAATSESAISKTQFAEFASYAAAEKSAAGAQAIAWFLLNTDRAKQALPWFESALAWSADGKGDAKTAEGYALVLKSEGRLSEAEAVAWNWQRGSADMRKLYVLVVVEELTKADPPVRLGRERLANFVSVVTAENSANGAQALGWYHQSRGEYEGSLAWFASAIAWSPEGKGDAKMNEGYALALKALGRLPEAEAIAWDWTERSADMRKLYAVIVTAELSSEFPRFSLSKERLSAFVGLVSADASATGAQALGWHHFNRGEYEGSLAWFRASLDWAKAGGTVPDDTKSVVKAAEGYALALQKLGKFDEAGTMAFEWRNKSQTLRGLYIGLTGQLLRAGKSANALSPAQYDEFVAAVTADRSSNGAQAIAWFLLNDNRAKQALPWFELALAWSADKKGDAKTNEGYALALKSEGRFNEAEAVAWTWHTANPDMKALYVLVVVEELTKDNPPRPIGRDRLANFVSVVAKDKSANGAQALGWYHHSRGEYEGSLAWFKAAIGWSPDGLGDAKYNEGYTLALTALGRLPEAESVARTWADRSADMRKLYALVVTAELSSEFPRYTLSKERLAAFVGIVVDDTSAMGAQALGWHHFMRGEFAGSLAWFRASLDWTKPENQSAEETKAAIKAAEGYAVSLQKLGKYEEAAAMAFEWRSKSPALQRLYVSLTGQMLRATGSATSVTAAQFDEYAATVTAEKSSSGAQAIAWFLLNTSRAGQAMPWFESAIGWSGDHKGDAKTNEGYALALKAEGRLAEAEAVTYAWQKAAADMKRLYVLIVVEELTNGTPPAVLPKERLANFVTVATREKSANGAQALGWYHHNRGEYEGSVAWFKYAIDWSPDGRGDQKMVEGYGLSLKALVFLPAAELATYPWIERSPELRELYKSVVIAELTRENPPQPIPEPRITAFANVISAEKSWQGAQAIGWYRYNRKEWQLGADWFYTSLIWAEPIDPENKVHPKTAEGYIYALKNLGRVGDAITLAYHWRDRWPAMRGVFAALTMDAMGSEKLAEAVSPEMLANFIAIVKTERSIPGAQALAWYYYARKDWQSAAGWFKAGLDALPVAGAAPPKVPQSGSAGQVLAAITPQNASLPQVVALDVPFAAKMLEGYTLSMRMLGRFEEASLYLLAWRDRVPAASGLYAGIMADMLSQPNVVLSEERVLQLGRLILAEKSVAAAQALGWYLNRNKDYVKALELFRSVALWSGDNGTDVKLMEGTVLALNGLGRTAEADAIVFNWRDKSPEMHALFVGALLNQLANSDAKLDLDVAKTAEIIRTVSAARDPAGAQTLAWTYIKRGEWNDALDWFKSAVAFGPKDKIDPKLFEGQAIALRNLNRGGDAFALISELSDKDPGLRALYLEMAVDELTKNDVTMVVPGERLTRHAATFTALRSTNGAQALGWYKIAHRDWAQAAEWFKFSMDWSKDGRGDAKIAEGYGIALQNLGRYDEAEKVVFAHAEKFANMRSFFVDIAASRLTATSPPVAVSADQLKRYAAAIVSTQSANGAQALAWYSFNIGQYPSAVAWFDKAMTWQASETSAVGLALSYKKMNNAQGYAHIINLYRGVYPKVAEIVDPRLARKNRSLSPQFVPVTGSLQPVTRVIVEAAPARTHVAVAPRGEPVPQATGGGGGAANGSVLAAFKAKDSVRCIAIADSLERAGRLTAQDSQIKGWCLMEQWRPQEAAGAFDQALTLPGGKKGDAAYGKSLALLKSNETEAAAAAANSAPMSAERRTTIGVEVLTQRAQAAYKAAHYAEALRALDQRAAFVAEQRDMLMLRGWSLYGLEQYEAAQRVFMTIDRQLSSSDSKKALVAVENKLNPVR